MSNFLQMDQLSRLAISDVLNLPVEQIVTLKEEIDVAAEAVKNAKAWLNAYMQARFDAKANEARLSNSKPTGIINIKIDDDYTLVADRKQDVKWDQTTLKAVWDKLSAMGRDPAHYIDYKVNVGEMKYKNAEADIKTILDAARTTEFKDQTFSFKLAASAKKAA